MVERKLLSRALTIRQWSGLLVAACVLPATVAALLLIFYSYNRERADLERATIATARALMQAVDRELSSAQGALEALATSPNLDDARLAAFQQQAAEVLRHRPGNNLVLADRAGRQLVNTLEPYGTALPRHGNPEQLQRLFATGKADVSDLYTAPVPHKPVVSVDVPVVRDGQVRYVLSMQFFGERLRDILVQQRIPSNWVVSILDTNGLVITRTRDPERFVGKHATARLSALMAKTSEGAIEDRTLEGIPSVAIFSRSAVSDWAIAIGVHRALFTEGLERTIAWLAGGAALLFLLGLLLAQVVGERLGASVRALVRPAIALGHGEPLAIPSLQLREADEVARALQQAADLLAQRTAERDQAAHAEHALREANRAMERSEAFLRGIFEETPDAVFLVAADGRVVRCNAHAERLFGYPPETLMTLPIDALLMDGQAHAEPPLRAMLSTIQARTEIGGAGRLRARRADGSTFPVELMASPLQMESDRFVIAALRDVTEREQAEEQLNALNKRLELATRSAGIGVWEFDVRSGELVWDERMYALYQVAPQDAGRNYEMWCARLHPEDRERAEREGSEAIAAGRSYSSEFRILRPDGQVRTLQAHAIVSRDSSGAATRMTGVNLDVTELRRKEADLRAALGEKETLLKELYHRVKNNLQVITSLFNLQVRTLPEGPARTALTESAARVRAMALVHEKLYQSGTLSSIALDAYVADLCTQLGRAASAAERGIALRVEVDPIEIGLEHAVPLGLLLNELISNCFKHAFADGRQGHIDVRIARAAGDRVRVRVADDGPGFPPGIDPTFSGALGLKLAAALASQLGGSLALDNEGGAVASLEFGLGGHLQAPRTPGGAET